MSSPIRVLLKRRENLTIVIDVDRSPYWEIASNVLAKLIEQGEECGFDPSTIEDILRTLLEDEPIPLQ